MTSPFRLSEADLQRRIIDTATRLGWMVSHTRPACTSHGWRTPVTGHRGAPDLLLARGGRCLLVELKSQSGRLGPGQRDWLEALGGHGRLWTPADWTQALADLKRRQS
jgi:VRR-NUC domain